MIDQLRSELLKVRSTRTTLGLLLGMIALTLIVVLLSGLVTSADSLDGFSNQDDLFAVGGVGLVFSALAGVLLISSEYRHGTICPTFLFTPADAVLGAKLIAGAITGLLFGVITVGISLGLGSLILSARGIPNALSASQLTLLALGGVGSSALSGIIGIGVGAIIRNQVGAIIALLAWDFVLNTLLLGLVPKLGHFMPTPAADAFEGLAQPSHLLPAAAGAIVLAGWAAVLGVIGAVLTLRRDVS